MITELAIASGVTYLWNYMNTKEERKVKEDWKSIMEGIGIKNKNDKTFTIKELKKTQYGYRTLLNTPKGLSEGLLLEKINVLENNLQAIVELDRGKFEPYITMRVVKKNIDNFLFEPVPCKLNEIYIGKNIKGENCILNLRKDCHILIAGMTGTGKTFLLSTILTNIIYNNPTKVSIYLSQLIKGEIGVFENCNGVERVDTTIDQTLNTLDKLIRIINDRSALFTQYGIRNIEQWNKHFPTKTKKEVFYIAEEFSFFMESPNLIDKIKVIAKAGRSVGVHLIGILQRTTATETDPVIKSQMTRITFKQKSIIDSQNVIGTNDATKLKDRELIVDGMNEVVQVKMPFVDEDFIMLHKFLPELRIPSNEEKQEIMNVKKQGGDQILITTIPNIIEIPEDEIEDVVVKDIDNSIVKSENKANRKAYNKKSAISYEEYLKGRRRD